MIEGFTVMWRTRCFFASINVSWLFIGIFNNYIKKEICPLVIGAARTHPVTSRTRSLSSPALMVLGGRPPGRVGHCQRTFSFKDRKSSCPVIGYSKPAIIQNFKYNLFRCMTGHNLAVCPKLARGFGVKYSQPMVVYVYHLCEGRWEFWHVWSYDLMNHKKACFGGFESRLLKMEC